MGKPENTFRKIRFLSIALALIGLAACGGSGDSVNSASQTVRATAAVLLAIPASLPKQLLPISTMLL